MRIGLDGRLIYESGLGTYTYELLKAMLTKESDFFFVLFLKSQQIPPMQKQFASAINTHKLELVEADFHWYGLTEQMQFPRLLRKHRIDLMHFPHFNISFFSRTPFIVTIHDLILLGYPSRRATRLTSLIFALKKIGYHLVMRKSFRKAYAIITFTKFGASDLHKHFPRIAKQRKIHVIPEGPGLTELPKVQSADKRALFKYNIKREFLLYVGNAYPHKNLEGLVLAFTKLLLDGWEYQLVIVGRDDDFRKELKERCRNLGIWGNPREEDKVVFTGFVSEDELALLYTYASVYVLPSFYEGFAFPELEAMRYGLAVVSSNRTCLPEILGDAVEYFDPADPENIAESVKKVLASKALREKLAQRGLEILKRYSWEQCAKDTLSLYNDFFTHANKKSRKKNPTT